MEILEGPQVVALPERHTAGIRVVTPFRGMFAVRDRLMAQLYDRGWSGLTFLRLHVVDMDGDMEIEVGVVTDGPVEADGRIVPGTLPAGDYAVLRYVNHGRRANGTLIDWVHAQRLRLDVADDPAGDRFACRYEAYLTDPRTERLKTRWQVELAIRLAPPATAG
ncbi:GyrI-like domain-containing protein [Actinoplanes sp. URMC 104]|uniref:GyrI-like domain-containing protein n=1 Tax=Actinoplanes sp. URMC 104 TaxID=3423409 RepID=UPI003F1B3262